MKTLTLARPDDWHCHLRDGDMLAMTVAHSAAQFGRAIAMPNLTPPITTVTQALAYRERIRKHIPSNHAFEPLMTLYLTQSTTPKDIKEAKAHGISAVKLYPQGATTHSDAGVRDITRCYSVFAAMQEIDLPLLIHGEVVDNMIDVFDKERVFIDEHLIPLSKQFPNLRIVLEHITTQDAVQFIEQSPPNMAATITAHHLLLNRNDLFDGGLRPHHYCLPILKREQHRKALLKAATSGNRKFFLGTDSAPHLQSSKENAYGCAGIYTAYAAMALYATAFDKAGALDKLEGFASFFGADFYGLARNQAQITLHREKWIVPTHFECAGDILIPLFAGRALDWVITYNNTGQGN